MWNTTDAQGRFVLSDPGPGAYRLRATEGARRGETEAFEVGPGQRVQGLRIILVAPVEVRVTVLDEEGRPAEGARVSARRKDPGGGPSRVRFTRTDARGVAVLDLEPGLYSVSASPAVQPDKVRRTQTTLTVGPAGILEVTLRFSR
jgi:hypothetical protein